jgi:DNA-binding response OmpR family regulator
MGFGVITTMDGQTGLAKAQEETPDIISDKLPDGGLEVLEHLRQKGVNIPRSS